MEVKDAEAKRINLISLVFPMLPCIVMCRLSCPLIDCSKLALLHEKYFLLLRSE